MGGFFRPSKPIQMIEQLMTDPAPAAPNPDQAASDARIANRQRALRGRLGTVATSDRGVLAPLPDVTRKTLLGE